MGVRMILRVWALWLAIISFWHPLLADTIIAPMPNPVPGTWQDRSEIKEILPLSFHSIWYEPETASLIHIQVSDSVAPVDRQSIDQWLLHMMQSTSFWGEPAHPNAAQFFANQVYLQPESYDRMLGPYVDQALSTGKGVETPAIWELPGMSGNPHIFYHAQITPRVAIENVDGQTQAGESYVPLAAARSDFGQVDGAEYLVVEVQTEEDAIDEAVDALKMPGWLKQSRFRYCAVLYAHEGFAAHLRTHVWLASPLDSGIDCDDVVTAFGP